MIPTRCGGTAAPSVGGETGAGSGRTQAGTVDQLGGGAELIGCAARRPTRDPASRPRFRQRARPLWLPLSFDGLDDPIALPPGVRARVFSVR